MRVGIPTLYINTKKIYDDRGQKKNYYLVFIYYYTS